MVIKRLSKHSITDLCNLLHFDLDEDLLKEACNGGLPLTPQAQMYGVYEDDALVSVALATFTNILPVGRTVYISGVYTKPEYRNKGYMSEVQDFIESDAIEYFKAKRIVTEACPESVTFYKSKNFVEQESPKLMVKLL